jgi:hypothetical protein
MISTKNVTRSVLSAFTVGALLLACLPEAKAEVAFPLWGCKLKATVQDSSVAILLGVVSIEGKGKIKCMTALGQKASRDVVIRIFGISAGPIIVLPTSETANLDVVSAAVGLASLKAVFGEYRVTAATHAQFGHLKASVNYDFLTFTPALPHGGISQNIALAIEQGGTVGLGVNVSVTGMSIEPAQPMLARR